MRHPMRAHGVRAAVPAGAIALALVMGGLAYGSSGDDNDSSTRGAQTGPAAPAGAGAVPETTNMEPKPGAPPSKTIPKGSTRDLLPPTHRKDKSTTEVDRSDRGAKNLKVRKDRGQKNLPVTTDLGAD